MCQEHNGRSRVSFLSDVGKTFPGEKWAKPARNEAKTPCEARNSEAAGKNGRTQQHWFRQFFFFLDLSPKVEVTKAKWK
jgi:hypothetical protein